MTLLYSTALIAGAWLLQQQPVLPSWTLALALVPVLLLRQVIAREETPLRRHAGGLIGMCLAFSVGFLWAATVANWKLAENLPEIWEGRDLELTGVIAEMVEPADRGVRFTMQVEQVHALGATVPSRISLTWYRPAGEALLPDLHAGQRWRLAARLHRPHGNANPGGFDLEAWLLERGIRAAGNVRMDPAPRMIDALVWRPGFLVGRIRELARERLTVALGDRPYAGVIVALAVGDQRAIPAEQWKVFTRTGVNHLMSISGLHITMVASLVFLVVGRLWRRSAFLVLRLPAVRAATMGGLLAAIAYAALSGFAVPAQRTVYMLAVVAISLWLGWSARWTAVMAIAAVAVVCVDPMAVISPGFWLSFGAVAVMLMAGSGRIGRPEWWVSWARAQWAVTLALIPFLLAMFQQVSVVSPLANAFAIPLVSLVVVPIALLAICLPFDALAPLAHAVMSGCMVPLEWLAGLPHAAWEQHAPTSWSVPLALAGALWMLLPRGFPARWAGIAWMLPLFMGIADKPGHGEVWLTVLDVGQGLATVVRTSDHALVFDTGPAFSDQSDAGARIVVPYLRHAGVNRLDGLIVSHDDIDHSGGALSVARAVPVTWFASSLPESHPMHNAAPEDRRCESGQSWTWDGVRFETLHPSAGSYNEKNVKDNDRSCVLRVVSSYGAALITADIERPSEYQLLQLPPGSLSADLLVVPHHGSRTSSTPEFVRAVAPRVAILALGHRNRFGHPHPAVVARYRGARAKILRTDVSGALEARMSAAGMEIGTARDRDRRYWQGR